MASGLFDLVEETGQLDQRSLETLESRINAVLDRLQTLQTEKQELQQQVASLQSRYEDAARRVDELTSECEGLRSNQRDLEQEQVIRTKITALLAKLEAA
jgi:FtsZ-binding cell division protein ZapB